jgi:hypothetical protein
MTLKLLHGNGVSPVKERTHFLGLFVGSKAEAHDTHLCPAWTRFLKGQDRVLDRLRISECPLSTVVGAHQATHPRATVARLIAALSLMICSCLPNVRAEPRRARDRSGAACSSALSSPAATTPSCDEWAVQVVDLVSGRDADVKGINGRLLRQGALPNQVARKLRGRFGERENRNPAKGPQPTVPHDRVASPSFISTNCEITTL